MVCRYCNAPLDTRFTKGYEAPCPHCGAPSPLIGAPMGSSSMYPGSAAQPHAMPQNQPSLLPVPYQQGSGLVGQDISAKDTLMMAAMGYHLPSLVPGAQEIPGTGESIHIPPMYTKPRAIIPPYRIISGLLSFLIVSTLFCSGAIYYAKASGKLAFVQQVWGGVQPPDLPSSKQALPIPPLIPDYGPAKNIIDSASTASKIDTQHNVALQPTNVFAPNQFIYLTYSVHAPTTGVVVLKWYTDGILFKTITTKPIAPAKNGTFTNGSVVIEYPQPVEGKVELYWNDQLAIRLYFVVR